LKQVSDAKRWCIAEMSNDGKIVNYIEKKELPIKNRWALVGYYHLMDSKYLKSCVDKAIKNGGTQISDFLKIYGKKFSIKGKNVSQWHDFGNLDNLVKARKMLLQPRHFNSLTVNPILNTITKVSSQNEKIINEINWYEELPNELKILTPRLIKHSKNDNKIKIIQEYYGYPTLAELYVYGELHKDQWYSILNQVIQIHNEFKSFKKNSDPKDIHNMYFEKTQNRLEKLSANDDSWDKILDKKEIEFNRKTLPNYFSLQKEIKKKIKDLTKLDQFCIIHGDFCFSNILFDLNNYIIRLIDPRGSFGKKGIYGDPRYDIAKLRHSICNYYDYIINDIFEIKEKHNGYSSKIFINEKLKTLNNDFDVMIKNAKYNLDEIKFIEGLIFISMLPLHSENFKRQIMMYLTGLNLLNEVFS